MEKSKGVSERMMDLEKGGLSFAQHLHPSNNILMIDISCCSIRFFNTSKASNQRGEGRGEGEAAHLGDFGSFSEKTQPPQCRQHTARPPFHDRCSRVARPLEKFVE
jgi:hypothetical protein